MKTERRKKEVVMDAVKEIFIWAAVTALAFLWWLAVLLIASLILLNVWKVTFYEILKLSIGFTILTAAGYGGRVIYRKLR